MMIKHDSNEASWEWKPAFNVELAVADPTCACDMTSLGLGDLRRKTGPSS
jgi:hypothetical protein